MAQKTLAINQNKTEFVADNNNLSTTLNIEIARLQRHLDT